MTEPSNWHKEDGFEFALFPAKTGKADCLVIFLHGFGGDASNCENIAQYVHEKIPGADFIALRAPIKMDPPHPNTLPGHDSFTWFPRGGSKISEAKAWLSHVLGRAPTVKQVEAFTQTQMKKRGFTEENLGLIGSSMGAMMALQVGLTGRKPVAGVAALSGSLLPFTKVRSKPLIIVQMGELDDVFNVKKPLPPKGLKRLFARAATRLSLHHEKTVLRLKKKKVSFTEKVYPQQGHSLDAAAWREGVAFVAKALKKSGPTP